MKDQLYFRVFTTNTSIWRRKMTKWQLYKYHPKQRVCMDWVDRPRNYKGLYGILQLCKVPIWTIFHRKFLNLVGQLFIHQHFSFNVQIFNLIDIRNSPQCPHVSAMGYANRLNLYSHFWTRGSLQPMLMHRFFSNANGI